jgi:hypothetical protein
MALFQQNPGTSCGRINLFFNDIGILSEFRPKRGAELKQYPNFEVAAKENRRAGSTVECKPLKSLINASSPGKTTTWASASRGGNSCEFVPSICL